jgi:hypothetical protein
MRAKAELFDIRQGYFFCRGQYGKAIATKKDVVLYDLVTKKVIKEASFKRHLDAKHTALRWAIEGNFE